MLCPEGYWDPSLEPGLGHTLGSGTSLLERGWTLFYAGVVPGERGRAGVSLLMAPWLLVNVLELLRLTHTLKGFVVRKRELSRKAKLSIYQSIYVPTLTYGHELWVVKEFG